MKMGNCATCVYFANVVGKINEKTGDCHRYPPQFTYGVRDDERAYSFPMLSEHDWCGEYKKA